MRDFSPRMKGAPMALISTEAVIRATDSLLAAAGMWRDDQGDVRLVGDPGPARVQILVVQATGVAGVTAAIALASAALGREEPPS